MIWWPTLKSSENKKQEVLVYKKHIVTAIIGCEVIFFNDHLCDVWNMTWTFWVLVLRPVKCSSNICSLPRVTEKLERENGSLIHSPIIYGLSANHAFRLRARYQSNGAYRSPAPSWSLQFREGDKISTYNIKWEIL